MCVQDGDDPTAAHIILLLATSLPLLMLSLKGFPICPFLFIEINATEFLTEYKIGEI